MKRLLSLFALMAISVSAFAHVFEIRYLRNPIDGSIDWFLQSYHVATQCNASDAGLTVTTNSGTTNYPVTAVLTGDTRALFPTSTLLALDDFPR